MIHGHYQRQGCIHGEELDYVLGLPLQRYFHSDHLLGWETRYFHSAKKTHLLNHSHSKAGSPWLRPSSSVEIVTISIILIVILIARRSSQRNYTRTEEYLAEMVLTYWSNFITSGFVLIIIAFIIISTIAIIIISIIAMMILRKKWFAGTQISRETQPRWSFYNFPKDDDDHDDVAMMIVMIMMVVMRMMMTMIMVMKMIVILKTHRCSQKETSSGQALRLIGTPMIRLTRSIFI